TAPAASEFDFRAMGSEPSSPEATAPRRRQEPPAEPEFAPKPLQTAADVSPESLDAATDEPRLAPVSSEPRLAPVSRQVAPAEREARDHAPAPRKKSETARRSRNTEQFEDVKRDRNVLTYGVAWTAFSFVITGIIAFTASTSGDPGAAAGPGPLIPGIASIAIGWVVVIASRAIGRYWGLLMIIPALVLLAGPYVYKNYWAGSIEDAAHSYLSNRGTGVLIDVDATSVVSETVNTGRGCFAINRNRKTNDTEIAVVTYIAETARQQADFAMAPRYAGRIGTGGERSTNRVFSFRAGRAPAVVSSPGVAPLDCENSVTAPGARAGVNPRDEDQSEPLK
ncbi:MAG: hypothetical protein WAP37_03130, partial [Solirubrobacterales bacterium]